MPGRQPARLLVVGVAGLVLAACAGDGGDGSDVASGSPSASGASVSPAPPTTHASTAGRASPSAQTSGTLVPTRSESVEGEPVITFAVEGGFTAQIRSLQIGADGAALAEVSGRRSVGRLPQDEVAAIVAELERSGLFSSDHTYPPPPKGADLQRYEIGYAGATVVAYDTTVPPELTEAVRLLQAALRATQG